MNMIFRYLRLRTLFRALRNPRTYRTFWILTIVGWLLNRRRMR